jgi:hypothetical protein
MERMIELISIHIPKTAGTSFYDILMQVYGDGLSPSYKRRDLYPVEGGPCLLEGKLDPGLRILHGHFTWPEVKRHYTPGHTKIITWLRDPVERVVSNYQFFIHRLHNPDLNPMVADLNVHRKEEPLTTYAALPENRNRMTQFLHGLRVEDFFFIGFTASFSQDVVRLGALLEWPAFTISRLNAGTAPLSVSIDERLQIEAWNQSDRRFFDQASARFSSPLRSISCDD